MRVSVHSWLAPEQVGLAEEKHLMQGGQEEAGWQGGGGVYSCLCLYLPVFMSSIQWEYTHAIPQGCVQATTTVTHLFPRLYLPTSHLATNPSADLSSVTHP